MSKRESPAKADSDSATPTNASSESDRLSRSAPPPPDGEVIRRVFPDLAAVFAHRPEPLQSILGTCDVVLDTNVLLLPYSARPEGFAAIRDTLSRLAGESRLFVPGRVAREYARNRPERLKELLQNIMNQKSSVTAPAFKKVPLIEGRSETRAVADAEAAIRDAVANYHEALQRVHDLVRDWQGRDPVSEFYAQVFSDSAVLVECEVDYAELRRDLAYRTTHRVPPGFKDIAKDDGGEGDVIIWRTILQLGGRRKRHLLFVSGDEKSDWQYRVNHTPILPRVELVEEYRRVSEGMSFHITTLSGLLQAFENTEQAIAQVESAETQQRVAEPSPGAPTRIPTKLPDEMERDDLVIVLGALTPVITSVEPDIRHERTTAGNVAA